MIASIIPIFAITSSYFFIAVFGESDTAYVTYLPIELCIFTKIGMLQDYAP